MSSPTVVSRLWKLGRQCKTCSLHCRSFPLLPRPHGTALTALCALSKQNLPAHGHPNISGEKIAVFNAFGHAFCACNARPWFWQCGSLFQNLVRSPQSLGGHGTGSRAQAGQTQPSGIAHIITRIAKICQRLLAQRFIAAFAHGKHVGQKLGGVPFVGKAVPHRQQA